jgi:hypothetical protein
MVVIPDARPAVIAFYPRESLDAWALKKLGPIINNTSQVVE